MDAVVGVELIDARDRITGASRPLLRTRIRADRRNCYEEKSRRKI
jgi:hypothetical protein